MDGTRRIASKEKEKNKNRNADAVEKQIGGREWKEDEEEEEEEDTEKKKRNIRMGKRKQRVDRSLDYLTTISEGVAKAKETPGEKYMICE